MALIAIWMLGAFSTAIYMHDRECSSFYVFSMSLNWPLYWTHWLFGKVPYLPLRQSTARSDAGEEGEWT